VVKRFKEPELPKDDGVSLQRVQVRQQIIHLFVGEHIAEAVHFVPPHANDVPGPVIIGWHTASGEIWPLEHASQTRSLALSRRIRRVAAVTILIVDVPPRGLLGAQS
jgi:hypothetical protein